MSFIGNNKEFFTDKNTLAITLGAGSTEASEKHVEELIKNCGEKLMSHTLCGYGSRLGNMHKK